MSSLGTIRNEQFSKDAQLFQQPLPASDSTEALVIDLFGAQATIKINGAITASISTAISELKALINGGQVRRTYVSDISGTYYVYVQTVDFEIEESAGGTKLNYSISMVEGSA
jgi:predicted transcriptional regulator